MLRTYQQEKNFWEQIQSRKDGLAGIVALVKSGEWEATDALERRYRTD